MWFEKYPGECCRYAPRAPRRSSMFRQRRETISVPERRLLPRRVAAHDTDGLDLQGLENVRRHEDETSA